ncbi:hypothetical protein CPB84DRAFT_1833411 [Gymnopilus junonius]|uniref:Uncharacterized protein n=1 Tax=Gymnopilus junonius TaxID=109634 RepID=A0A9P5TUH6_GYMJU|nr:hypothetical protein CPB84DRAFT_1833411 [Gymnopilus junonius]
MPSLFRHFNRARTTSTGRKPDVLSPLQYDTTSTYFRHPKVMHSPTDVEAALTKDRYYNHEHQAGAEPGVNPRSGESTIEYDHFKQDCFIEIVDYDYEDVSFQRFTNEAFINFLRDEAPSTENGEDHLPPRMVRWINIAGIDWSVLRAVALRYNLHSLALEDILHERGHTHSKADYYPGHLFLRVLCHSLEQSIQESGSTSEDSSSDSVLHDSKKTEVAQDEIEILMAGDVRKTSSGARSDTSSSSKPAASLPPDPQDDKGKGKTKSESLATNKLLGLSLKKRLTGLSGFARPAREEKKMQIEILKAGDRVLVKHEPMFIFLLSNGTVISIHPSLSLLYTAPITERLHRQDSVLRSSEDASLLVESLLDLIVDRVLEVVDEYQVKINKLEYDILLHPVMRRVRSLHILSGDLILHKRTLEPIRTMVFGLRRYDLERCRALADNIAVENESSSEADVQSRKESKGEEKPKETAHSVRRRRRRKQMLKTESFLSHQAFPNGNVYSSEDPAVDQEHMVAHENSIDTLQREQFRRLVHVHKAEGYFSYKAKVYLADVADHIDFAITSIDMFAGVSENLINYAFNIASYEMNRVMNRLTMATIIFLPLTLLTGYFGMNFQAFWSVANNSDLFFWEIAIPVMICLVPIFMYNDIRDFVYFLRKKSLSDGIRS